MEYFIQQLINGITLGSIYGLIAIGYTMVYGIIGMINFAHGDIFMIGAFIALIAFVLFGLTGIALPIVLFLVFYYYHINLQQYLGRKFRQFLPYNITLKKNLVSL